MCSIIILLLKEINCDHFHSPLILYTKCNSRHPTTFAEERNGLFQINNSLQALIEDVKVCCKTHLQIQIAILCQSVEILSTFVKSIWNHGNCDKNLEFGKTVSKNILKYVLKLPKYSRFQTLKLLRKSGISTSSRSWGNFLRSPIVSWHNEHSNFLSQEMQPVHHTDTKPTASVLSKRSTTEAPRLPWQRRWVAKSIHSLHAIAIRDRDRGSPCSAPAKKRNRAKWRIAVYLDVMCQWLSIFRRIFVSCVQSFLRRISSGKHQKSGY